MGMYLVQSPIRVLTSTGQFSRTVKSCSRPCFTGVVRVTIWRPETSTPWDTPWTDQKPALHLGNHRYMLVGVHKHGQVYITFLSNTPRAKMSACTVDTQLVILHKQHFAGAASAICTAASDAQVTATTVVHLQRQFFSQQQLGARVTECDVRDAGLVTAIFQHDHKAHVTYLAASGGSTRQA
jgi:hypothetical protein